ncbi:hypothetical protein HMPREF3232_01488 [Fannyhessea vaginae]|nr:hypothetical protein HMPREF3232_01488 [Fannyhessea vaginae]
MLLVKILAPNWKDCLKMKDFARKWDFAKSTQLNAALDAREKSAVSEASLLLRVHCATCLQRANDVQ